MASHPQMHPTQQEPIVTQAKAEKSPHTATRKQKRWFFWTGGTLALLLIAAGSAIAWMIRNAEPILRRRVVETLSARFNSPVELDSLKLAYSKDFLVTGTGLRIRYIAGPERPDVNPSASPMLIVPSFEFTTSWRELLRPTSRVLTVHVQGMQIDIPPRAPGQPDNPKRRGQPRWGIAVDKIVCTDTRLVLETSKPGKKPLVFEISNLTLTDVGAKKPFNYEAQLINPKPVGDIHSTGRFGPWQDDNPRDTPLNGAYEFSHVDLSSIRGIAGTLSSTGNFGGTLGNITVDGETDTPDFRLDLSEHPVALHTDFHAIVDGTTGDTRLDPVHATVLHSHFTAAGAVTRTPGASGHDTPDHSPGHNIELDVSMDKGRIEDMLILGVKTSPPLLHGALTMKTHISLPPGPVRISKKVRMQGTFAIHDAAFSNPAVKKKIDALSMRAQGKAELANTIGPVPITSAMSGDFSLADTVLQVSNLTYHMPGADARMTGQYSLATTAFDFQGTVRTQATASQMTTGWKSVLISPFDSLFKKSGAGLEVPIRVTGQNSEYDIKLNYGHGKSPQSPPTPAPPTRPK